MRTTVRPFRAPRVTAVIVGNLGEPLQQVEKRGRDGGSRTRNAIRYELRPGTARIAAM